VDILEQVLGGETSELSSADLATKLKNPTTRQMHMQELVQKGQEKISKASRITTGIGEVADFVLSAKSMIDLVLQSVPQTALAALPWAGVCLGLQVNNRLLNIFLLLLTHTRCCGIRRKRQILTLPALPMLSLEWTGIVPYLNIF
jgi:hypothetical protein